MEEIPIALLRRRIVTILDTLKKETKGFGSDYEVGFHDGQSSSYSNILSMIDDYGKETM